MNRAVTVLISSAGRRVQLLECFRDAGRALGCSVRIVAADLRPELSAACQLADLAAATPPCGNSEYVPALLALCEREQVDLLVPTIDTELAVLAEQRDRFEVRGVHVAISHPSVVAMARDKVATAVALAQAGISTPHTILASDYVAKPDSLRWPVILKPRCGSSSKGIVRPCTPEDAIEQARLQPTLIVQELWLGREYTVNVFFDRNGRLCCAVPHWRIETRGGEVAKGCTERIVPLCDTARQMTGVLTGARGALCFQAIVREDNAYAIFEINARFGGGYPLAHRAGACFARWLLEERLDRPSTASDEWESGITMIRYDAAVFRHD